MPAGAQRTISFPQEWSLPLPSWVPLCSSRHIIALISGPEARQDLQFPKGALNSDFFFDGAGEVGRDFNFLVFQC